MQDLRLAIRALMKTPLVSAVAVLSLALGIGANTAVFSVVNSLVLRPLPVANPGALATITSDLALGYGLKAGAGWNYPMWQRLEERLGLFGGGLVWTSVSVSLGAVGGGERVNALFVDGGFFQTLGVRARYGRTIGKNDDVQDAQGGRVAVISHRLWQRQFGGQTSVVGTPIVIEGATFTIVGVTPPDFFGVVVGQSFDVALPMTAGPLVRGGPSLTSGRAYMLIPMLRLKPGQSVQAATAALRAIHADLLGVSPDRFADFNPSFLRQPFVLVPAPTGISDRGARAQFEQPLFVMSIAMGLVLLVGSLNLANLSLSRAAARRYEMGVRVALGAPLWQLARRVFVECALVSGAGAVTGLVVAIWAGRALVAHLSNANAALFLYLPFDWRVLSFTATVALATTLLFGLVPAYGATRTTADVVRGQQSLATRRRPLGVAGSFVLVQVALSLVLVAGTGLFARTFQRLANAPLGFDPGPVLIMELGAGQTGVDKDVRADLYQRVIDRLAATPGVAAAGASGITPLGTNTRSALLDDPNRIPENPVTPGWFGVYRTRLLRGRAVDATDVRSGPAVAIVNESYARKYLAGQDPIGQQASSEPRPAGVAAPSDRTIVGVVADAAFGSVRQGARPTMYVPLTQSGLVRDTSTIRLSVRSAGADPSALVRSLAASIAGVDPNLTVSTRRLTDDVTSSIASERSLAALSSAFGVLALLLAGLGLYGVTSSAVAARRREMAIRMALGMVPAGGVRLVLTRVGLLVGAGIAAGLVAGLWLTKFIATMLYGLDPRDPVAFGGSAVVLAAVGLLAAWRPARQASRIDPAELLRDN